MSAFEQLQPAIYAMCAYLQSALGAPDYQQKLEGIWDTMPKLSIDVAIMERAENIAVIPVDIGWSDIGRPCIRSCRKTVSVTVSRALPPTVA